MVRMIEHSPSFAIVKYKELRREQLSTHHYMLNINVKISRSPCRRAPQIEGGCETDRLDGYSVGAVPSWNLSIARGICTPSIHIHVHKT